MRLSAKTRPRRCRTTVNPRIHLAGFGPNWTIINARLRLISQKPLVICLDSHGFGRAQ